MSNVQSSATMSTIGYVAKPPTLGGLATYKFDMSLTRDIAKNTGIQMVGRVASIGLALLAMAIMTRALGPEGFGGYSTIIAFLQFFGITVDFGLTLTANRMLGAMQDKEEASRLMSNLLTLRFISAVVFLGLAPVVALFFPYPAVVKQGMFLTSFSFLAIIMGQTLVPVFQKELKMIYPTIAELFGRIVLVVGVAVAAYVHAGFLWFMAAIVVSSIAQYGILRTYVSKYLAFHWAFDWSMWRRIIITSWPIGVSIIFNLIYLKADTILLSVWRSQAEVGFYGGAYRVIDQFTAAATMFVNLILPPMTSAWVARDVTRFKRMYGRAFDGYAILAFPLMVGAIFVSRPLMQFVAGADFEPAGGALAILMIGMVAVFFSTLFGHTIVILEKQKPMIFGYAATAVFGLALYAYAIPRYGMIGAAWSTVATEMLIMVITFFVVWKSAGVVPRFGVAARSAGASVVMGLFLYAASDLQVVPLILSGAIMYAAALYLLGGIKAETIREMFSFRDSPS